MFESLIATCALLVAGLSIPSIQPNKKRSVGKKLAALHSDLTLLYDNGVNILNNFSKHNNGEDIDIDIIKILLKEQHYLIHKILSFFDNSEIKTVFNIRAPELTPLKFKLYDKSDRVAFYLNGFDNNRRRGNEQLSALDWLSQQPRMEVPEESEIGNSKSELESINEFNENIRQFLISNFDISEII